MKRLFTFFTFTFVATQIGLAEKEQPMLACVTAYWRAEGCGFRASSNGARLRSGDCAVDPRKIPYGSRVIMGDVALRAVDTGPDVVNRKAARRSGRNTFERNAIVIDRFFETKSEAMQWTATHPRFTNVWVQPAGLNTKQNRIVLELNLARWPIDQLRLPQKQNGHSLGKS